MPSKCFPGRGTHPHITQQDGVVVRGLKKLGRFCHSQDHLSKKNLWMLLAARVVLSHLQTREPIHMTISLLLVGSEKHALYLKCMPTPPGSPFLELGRL